MANDPSSEIKAIQNAVLAGFRYGFKLRAPHALVMTFLFKSNKSWKEKMRIISKLSLEHAVNLGAFAGLYKTILAILKYASQRISNNSSSYSSSSWIGRMIMYSLVKGSKEQTAAVAGIPEKPHHAFLAGSISGYLVWGRRYSAINYQIVLYLASRVFMGCMFLLAKKVPQKEALQKQWKFRNHVYPILASWVWGLVMILFEENADVLHPSLKSSMDEIYRYGILPDHGDDHKDDAIEAKKDAAEMAATKQEVKRPFLRSSTSLLYF